MKKLKVIALALACALIFSGCSLMTVDPKKVQAQVVATVNGTPITRQQVENEAMSSEEYAYYAYYYGMDEEELKSGDMKEWYEELLNKTLDTMVENELLLQKAPELGISLTDEEKSDKRALADQQLGALKDQLRIQVESELNPEPSPTDEASETPSSSPSPEESAEPTPTPSPDPAVEAEVEKKYQEALEKSGFTADTYYEYLCNQAIVEKVKEHIKNEASVSDEDVKKWYDDTLAVQQEEMEEDPTVFSTKMNSNLICTYVPEDTIAVKQVLVKYKDTDLQEVAQKLYTDGKTEEAMELLEGEIASLMPTMNEIQQKLNSGESIDALIEEYNEDPGMTSGTSATIGYLVGASTTSYVKEFTDAALKLKSVGEVSAPFATYYGVHVMQVIKVYNKGVVPFDDIKDQIKTALLPSKQDEKLAETTKQWLGEAKVTYDRGRLTNG
jgi:parvulin-like peptidyl-prolyl isomerase